MAILKSIKNLIQQLEKEISEHSNKVEEHKYNRLGFVSFEKERDVELMLEFWKNYGIPSSLPFDNPDIINVCWDENLRNKALNKLYSYLLFDLKRDIEKVEKELTKIKEELNHSEFISYLKKSLKTLKNTKENTFINGEPHSIKELYLEPAYIKKIYPNVNHRFEIIWRHSEQNDNEWNIPAYKAKNGGFEWIQGKQPWIPLDLKLWFQLEKAYKLIPCYESVLKKLPQRIHKCPFDIKSNIFEPNGQDILYSILLESQIFINKENGDSTKTSRFKGACAFFFDTLNPKIHAINLNATKKEFIEYLNKPNGYNAKINPDGSKLTNRDTQENAASFMKNTLEEIYPYIDFNITS